MAVSNIARTTPNPDGGEILKDARGNPTGLLRETASRLVREGRRRADADGRPKRMPAPGRCWSVPTRK